MCAVGALERLLADAHDRLVKTALERIRECSGDVAVPRVDAVAKCVVEISAALRCLPVAQCTDDGAGLDDGAESIARVTMTGNGGGAPNLADALRMLKALRHSYLDVLHFPLQDDGRLVDRAAIHGLFDAAELALAERDHARCRGASRTDIGLTTSASVVERILETGLSGLPHQVYAFDVDLMCVFASIGLGAQCPVTPGAVGRRLQDFDLSLPFAVRLATDAQQVLETDHAISSEAIFTHEGRTLHCGYWLRRVPAAEGETDLVCLTLTDLTELRAIQQAHREATDWLRAVYAAAPVAIVSLDLDGKVTSWSPGAERIFGWTEAEILGRRYPIVDHERWDEFLHTLARAVSGEPFRGVEARRKHRDGSHLDVTVSTAALCDPNGRAIGVVAILVDTTARREMERDLRLSEERFARMTEVVPVVFATLSHDGKRVLEISAGYESVLGYPPEPLLEQVDVWKTIVHPDDAPIIEQVLSDGLRAEQEGECRIVTADGATKWVRVHVCPVLDALGAVETISVFAMDITAYKVSESALTESRDTAWALLNATSDMAMLVDAQLRVLGVNEAFARALGASVGELLGIEAFEHIDAEIASVRRARAEEAIRTGLPVHHEDEYSGRSFFNRFYPVCGADGRVLNLAVFCRDVSDRRRAEDAQRLAAVGQLAAGVAHEFNNLLASMMMRAGLAAASGSDDDYQKLAELVLQMCERGSELTGSLITLTQPRPPRKSIIDITEPIEAALAAAAQEIRGHGVEIKRHYDGGAGPVLADAKQLEQVFLNLVINACHAMPQGGVLSISTNSVRRDAGPGKIVVTVSDTGEGIAPEHLPRIFEPFFTTKGLLGRGSVPGTGLGLSVSHGIVNGHGGSVDAESRLGIGTTMRITLDACEPSAAGGDDKDGHGISTTRAGARTVLFADDEPELCEIIAEALTIEGYHVTAVPDTDEALEALVEASFDLVITDLLMPGAGGKAVVAAANAMDPRPTVLVVTGRVGEGLAQELIASGADGCLQKPFAVPELLAAIEQLTGGPAKNSTR